MLLSHAVTAALTVQLLRTPVAILISTYTRDNSNGSEQEVLRERARVNALTKHGVQVIQSQ